MFRFLLLLFVPGLSWAQVSSGSLLGDVRDSSGGLMSDVTVTAVSTGTGFIRKAVTASAGAYSLEDLAPDTYAVTAQKNGFRTSSRAAITLDLSQKRRLDFTLLPGPVHDTVTVDSHSSALQSEDNAEEYLLPSKVMNSLPLPQLNVMSLVTLGAGVIPRQLGGFTHDIINDLQAGRGAVALNPPVNGARSTANAYLLDGANNTDRNTFSIALIPPLNSVSEFRVQTALASAEFSQAGGAVVNMVTQSGTKEFHGSLFDFSQNEATDAKGFFEIPDLPRGIFRQQQFGAALGGPLSSRNYFFVNYEGLREKSGSATQHLVPDSTVRAGDFSNRSPIFDPLSLDSSGARVPFAGNVIPASRIDPVTARYLEIYEPLPNAPNSPSSNFIDSTPNQNQDDTGLVRLDRSWNDRQRVFFRFAANDDRNLLAGAFPERPTSESLRALGGVLGHVWSGNSWVLETHLALTRLRVFDLPLSAFQTNVAADLGIHGLSADPFTFGLPSLTVTDFDTVQDSSTLPQEQRDNLWYASTGLSKTTGRHTWKAGFQWTTFQMAYLRSQYPRGQFLFNGGYTADLQNPNATGDAFADFLLGFPVTTKRSGGASQAYLRQNSFAAFLQDDWHPLRRLTIGFGVRYEYTAPFSEERNRLFNLDYSTLPADPVLIGGSTAVNPDRNNFAPRIGLAWNLPGIFEKGGGTVFRAGYGIYFSPEIAEETYDLVLNGVPNVINEPGGVTPLLTLQNGFPTTQSTGFPSYFGLDRNARTPYVGQWSANVQRSLPGKTLFEIAYIGTKGTDLGRFRRFNTPAHVETGEDLPPRPGDLQSLRTFPDLGTIFQREHLANSIYHSLQVKAERRWGSRLAFLASFVWSKSIDDADSVVPGQYESFGAQDERNLRLERGLSFFDVRRRVSAGYTLDLPGVPHMHRLLSHWVFAGTLIMQDGTPLNPVYFATDFANSGTPNRPNVVPGVSPNLPASQRNADHFFNTAAFSDPAPFTFGDAGRDTLPGPGNVVLNSTLHRRFGLGEHAGLEMRADVFNLLNHPNIGIPGPYPDFGPFFGKAFSAGDPRRLQFALRSDF